MPFKPSNSKNKNKMNISDKTNINSKKNENMFVCDCAHASEKEVLYLVWTHILFEEDILGWCLLEANHL